MSHFLASSELKSGEVVRISGPEAEHALRVRRIKAGDSISLIDQSGTTSAGIVREVEQEQLSVEVGEVVKAPPLSPTILGLAVTKKPALEEAVQHATELGATTIALFQSEHSPIPLKEVPERLTRIAIEACKQSGRAIAPDITWSPSLEHLLTTHETEKIVVLDQHKHEVAGIGKDESVLLLVGPEGGLSDDEQTYLKQYYPAYLSLSSLTLRAPTAALAGLGALNLLRK